VRRFRNTLLGFAALALLPATLTAEEAGENARPLKSAQVLRLRDTDGKFCLASDGSIWAESHKYGLVRFDGKRWDPVQALRGRRRVEFFMPGCDGAMLLKAGNFYLVTPKRVHSNASLRKLIELARADVAAAFRRGAPPYGHFGHCIAPDRDGNIWLLDIGTKRQEFRGREREVEDPGKLCVLAGDRWIEGSAALGEAGSRWKRTYHLAPLGDGRRIYMTDFLLAHDHGRSFYGEVKDGKIVLTPAPHTSERVLIKLNVRDPDNRLWLPANESRAQRTCDHILSQKAYRLAGEGEPKVLTNSGWPLLYDGDGTLWLGRIRGRPPNQFHVWRGDEIVTTVLVPMATKRTKLFAERPGSVLAWTGNGLERVSTPDPADPAQFEAGPRYACPEFKWTPQVCYSHGHVFALVPRKSGRKNRYDIDIYERYLYVIPVPEPEVRPVAERPDAPRDPEGPPVPAEDEPAKPDPDAEDVPSDDDDDF